MPRALIDLKGQKFGSWTVLSFSHTNKHAKNSQTAFWLCVCVCGTQRPVAGTSLRNGKSRSCRTCKIEYHGLTSHPQYPTWIKMNSRCYNPKDPDFPYFGGRGIRVHPEWRKSFLSWLEYMGYKPYGRTLDRISIDGHFEPGNVHWTTFHQQQSNYRKLKPRKKTTFASMLGIA